VRPDARWAEDAASRPLGVYYRIDKDSIVDLQAAIQEVGAIYVSADVHEDWFGAFDTMADCPVPIIPLPGDPTRKGGHAFAIVGYNRYGFIVQNSWGHLVGHSAGSHLLGHMLDALGAKGFHVATCTLFAPACSVPFAVEHYLASAQAGILDPAQTVFEILSDERELADSVGPYGRSLLYLVSRALEEHHRMPLLGMATSWVALGARPPFSEDADHIWVPVRRWQTDWKGPAPTELKTATVSDGEGDIPAAHGSFDNDVEVVSRTLTRILGSASGAALKAPIENLRGF
jgi:hypothetical protein